MHNALATLFSFFLNAFLSDNSKHLLYILVFAKFDKTVHACDAALTSRYYVFLILLLPPVFFFVFFIFNPYISHPD